MEGEGGPSVCRRFRVPFRSKLSKIFVISPYLSSIPLFLWYLVARDVSVFKDALIQVYRNSLLVPTLVIFVGVVVGTELLVASFFFRYVSC